MMSPQNYALQRCPGCRQSGLELRTCQASPRWPKKPPCLYVKLYRDPHGGLYKVAEWQGFGVFMVWQLRSGRQAWHRVNGWPWCDTFDQAQSLLNAHAKRAGWKEAKGTDEANG